MKLISTFAFVAFIYYFQYSLADNSDQVKVVMYVGDFANNSYLNTDLGELTVTKVNETYNRVHLKTEVVKEWPLDTTFTVYLHRSKSMEGPWIFVDMFKTKICDKNDENREHLPYYLLSMSRTDGTSCVPEGNYEYNDAGIFQYCEIIRDGQGYYYQNMNVLATCNTTISITRAWSKWGNVSSDH